MDDLKLYTKDDDDLDGLLSPMKQFNDDMKIQFGLEECVKVTFKKSSLANSKISL